MNENPLGKKVDYSMKYDPSLLFPIGREQDRQSAGIDPALFTGYDIWNGWELTWLGPKGKPEVSRIRLVFDAHSAYMIESKSLKLYLGSLAMHKFLSTNDLVRTIRRDLETVCKSTVQVFLLSAHSEDKRLPQAFLLDDQDTEINIYTPTPGLLLPRVGRPGDRAYISHLLRSNCPVTGQPDFGSVYIRFKSDLDLDPGSLLRYIVSYRLETGFHELTCEKIFRDLNEVLSPKVLVVKCAYTRRGGLDITPCRFLGEEPDHEYNIKEWRS